MEVETLRGEVKVETGESLGEEKVMIVDRG